MGRRITRLTVDTLAELPQSVRGCLQWELDPVHRARLRDPAAREAAKEAWVSRVLLEWGSCGRVVCVDDVPAGFVLYAPPSCFAGTASFPTAPLSEDAVQLATAQVFAPYAGGGLGRLLMQVMVKELVKRGDIRAVECIGSTSASGADDCVLPVAFLQRVGFKTHRPHPVHPRMRLELRSVVTWREEVETAFGRLIGAVRPGQAPEPAVRARNPALISSRRSTPVSGSSSGVR